MIQGISSTIERVEIKSIQKKKLQKYPFLTNDRTKISKVKREKKASIIEK
jgi:hypothetical protein